MTKQEAIAEWTNRPLPPAKTFSELVAEASEWSFQKVENMVNGETDYRRGYAQGLQFAINAIVELKRKGFTRPREIANILGEHQERVVLLWRLAARDSREVARDDYGQFEPKFSFDEWSVIRQQVFDRDGYTCAHCGATEGLEIDHIESVRDGARQSSRIFKCSVMLAIRRSNDFTAPNKMRFSNEFLLQQTLT
jgi:hypothetical protein